MSRAVNYIVNDKALIEAYSINGVTGPVEALREDLKESVLKVASGQTISMTNTSKNVLQNLGLTFIHSWDLTTKGKEYLYKAFANQ